MNLNCRNKYNFITYYRKKYIYIYSRQAQKNK